MGQIVVDAVARPVDRFPEPGGLVLFDHLELTNGGCAINTAGALAAMGASL